MPKSPNVSCPFFKEVLKNPPNISHSSPKRHFKNPLTGYWWWFLQTKHLKGCGKLSHWAWETFFIFVNQLIVKKLVYFFFENQYYYYYYYFQVVFVWFLSFFLVHFLFCLFISVSITTLVWLYKTHPTTLSFCITHPLMCMALTLSFYST